MTTKINTDTLRPLHDWVVVEWARPKDVILPSGIVAPGACDQLRKDEGTVIAIGGDNPLGLEVGDYILFGEILGAICILEDRELAAVKPGDIHGVMEDSRPQASIVGYSIEGNGDRPGVSIDMEGGGDE